MPDCRKPLVAAASEANPSLHILVGDMAHIVGEKDSQKSPRGLFSLSQDDRNRYPNLILLCQEHHRIIDQDEEQWPIERLYMIKSDHEVWVSERLGRDIPEEQQIYFDFIDRVVFSLELSNWEWLCDHLFRGIMPPDFPEGIYQLDLELFRSQLPGLDTDFETSLRNLVGRARSYVDHYMSNADIDGSGTRIMGVKRYRETNDFGEHGELLNEYNTWERNCTMLLFNLVKEINDFCTVVRKRLHPGFYIRKGQFCVHDFMGLMGGTLKETWHIPDRYFTEEDLASPIQDEEDG